VNHRTLPGVETGVTVEFKGVTYTARVVTEYDEAYGSYPLIVETEPEPDLDNAEWYDLGRQMCEEYTAEVNNDRD
jgi:hypothetical protein